MILLATTAHPQIVKHRAERYGEHLGRLIQPRALGRLADTAALCPWAADNDCFQRLDAERYRAMLAQLPGLPGCLFVTVPDLVADARGTLDRWREWSSEVRETTRQPLAFVAQDGCDTAGVPWDEFDALFLGGSTEFKLSARAERLVTHALGRGMHVHMGRVNSEKRVRYAAAIGCHSFDGLKWVKWRDTYLAEGLRFCADGPPRQLRIAES